MKKIAARGLALALAFMMVPSASAFADGTSSYVKVTNEDGSDPVYLELTEQNSTQTDSGLQLNEDQKEEGKIYSETIVTSTSDVSVYQITGETDNVESLTEGTTYSFVTGDEAKNIEVGDILTEVPDGGATLTYTGDGTDCTDDPTYYYSRSTSVVNIFQNDKELVEDYIDYTTEIIENVQNSSSAEDYANAKVQKWAEWYGFENVETVEDYEAACVDQYWDYYSNWFKTKEEAVAYYTESESKYLTWEYDKYLDYSSELLDSYRAVLADMNQVDANDEEAILAYTGLTEEEYMAKKGAWAWSNSPVVANSGTVAVVEAGDGFDSCRNGVIFYDENLGWSYACTGGGVEFGDVQNMHLYNVNQLVLEADAFQVAAGDSVQLNEDGTGSVSGRNIKVTCTLPDGTVSDVMTYDFIDQYVDKNDSHATVLLNGRYYTVSLNVLEYLVESGNPVTVKSEDGDSVVIQAVMTIPTLSDRINQGFFSGLVQDKTYENKDCHSVAQVKDNILEVIADMDDNESSVRRLVLSDKLVSAMKEAKVAKLVFTVGEYTVTMTTDQLNGLSDVIITVDPSNGECIITVDGVDSTASFDFVCGKN